MRPYADTGADLAWRVVVSVSIDHVRWLPDGSYRPGLRADRRRDLVTRARADGDINADVARLVRVLEYTVPERNPDGELITVVTTILNPHEIPAPDLAAAYQQRWEEESALGEIKTDLRSRGEVLRSKTPDLVEQQMWGLLLAHYAIRALLVDAADPAGYDPDNMSFIQGVRVVRRQVTDQAAITPERLNAALADTIAELLRHRLPPHRHRTCPRAIKRARHNSYRVKRPTDHNTRHPGPPTPRLACPNTLI